MIVRYKSIVMNDGWFRRTGIFFIPDSFPGSIITVGVLAYLIHVILDIYRKTASNEEKVCNCVINFLIVFIGYSVIGFFTSKKVSDH